MMTPSSRRSSGGRKSHKASTWSSLALSSSRCSRSHCRVRANNVCIGRKSRPDGWWDGQRSPQVKATEEETYPVQGDRFLVILDTEHSGCSSEKFQGIVHPRQRDHVANRMVWMRIVYATTYILALFYLRIHGSMVGEVGGRGYRWAGLAVGVVEVLTPMQVRLKGFQSYLIVPRFEAVQSPT